MRDGIKKTINQNESEKQKKKENTKLYRAWKKQKKHTENKTNRSSKQVTAKRKEKIIKKYVGGEKIKREYGISETRKTVVPGEGGSGERRLNIKRTSRPFDPPGPISLRIIEFLHAHTRRQARRSSRCARPSDSWRVLPYLHWGEMNLQDRLDPPKKRGKKKQ